MHVKRAEKHMHQANLVRGVYMELLNFCEHSERPNPSTNLKKKLSDTQRVSM